MRASASLVPMERTTHGCWKSSGATIRKISFTSTKIFVAPNRSVEAWLRAAARSSRGETPAEVIALLSGEVLIESHAGRELHKSGFRSDPHLVLGENMDRYMIETPHTGQERLILVKELNAQGFLWNFD